MRAGGRHVDDFHEMVRIVERLGCLALTELSSTVNWGDLPGPTFGADGKARGAAPPPEGDAYIYTRDLSWLGEADALVAEVSQPSLGVGYEIACALHVRKVPVLCLCHQDVTALSAMIAGNTSALLRSRRYSDSASMTRHLREFIDALPAGAP